MSIAITDDGKIDLDAANKALDEYATVAQESKDEAGEKDKTISGDSTSDDDKSVEGDAAAKEGGDEWWRELSEDLGELVESLGLSEDDLSEFDGPEEVERHAKILDKQLMKLGNRPGDEQVKALESKDEQEKKEELSERVAERPRGQDGRFIGKDAIPYEPELSSDEYDEQLVSEFKKMGEHFEGRILRLESMLRDSEERLRQSERQQYDTLVDSLGHPDLFGDPDQPRTKAHRDNKSKLLDTADVIAAGMKALGRNVSVTPALLKRALNQEFADHLSKKQRQDYAKRVKDQSKKRLSGGGSSAINKSDRWNGSPEKDPVLREFWDRVVKDNGGR